jgi:plastocyanin
MKVHLFIFQMTAALLFIFVFPIYFAMSANIPAASKADVEIYKFKFIPQEITVKAGTTIRWTNKEKRQYHSVWFEKQGEPEPEYFFPDEFYERNFTKTGSFPYRCGPHPKMTGVVHVK